MTWQVIEQEEKYGKVTKIVKCKRLRFFPIENKGVTHFMGLKIPILQVVLQDEKGEQLRVKMNLKDGIEYPTFVIQHPDTMDFPKFKAVKGGRTVEVPDILAPKVKVPGMKEKYDCLNDLRRRISQFSSAFVAEEVENLFFERACTIMPMAAAA